MSNKIRAPGRRSQAESARTQARVLDRAERLFARKGYRGLSLRELARAAGVQPNTIQHHFGSKPSLYQAVLARWDAEVLERVSRALKSPRDFAGLVGHAVDELFEFFLERRDWMAVNARAALGEDLPKGIALEERSWVRFIESAIDQQGLDGGAFDLGLMLITIEGILNNHVLAAARYRHLFDRDLTDQQLLGRTKEHLKQVILALLNRTPGAPITPGETERGTWARSNRSKV